nr:MAG TPA: hypothetical protein [Caudoviricetes sp.]
MVNGEISALSPHPCFLIDLVYCIFLIVTNTLTTKMIVIKTLQQSPYT